jgi:hypothetical protein
MIERGMYVVEPWRVYKGTYSIEVKIKATGIYQCITDGLIKEAKRIANRFNLSEFAIIKVDYDGNKIRLYTHG